MFTVIFTVPVIFVIKITTTEETCAYYVNKNNYLNSTVTTSPNTVLAK